MLRRFKRFVFDVTGRLARCDPSDTIVLAGAPRSGTTWLLEILRNIPGYKALNEPLMYEEVRQQHGSTWRPHVAPGEHRPQIHACQEEILAGQLTLPSAWHFSADRQLFRLLEHASQSKLVVKYCRAGRMLQWLCREFDLRGTILMIRHPCAVISSMLKHGSWDQVKFDNWLEKATEAGLVPDSIRHEFDTTLSSVGTRVEALAATWCLDYYVPLYHHEGADHPWVFTTYERLVCKGTSELERVAKVLEVDVTRAMRTQLGIPSSSVQDRPREAKAQLSKWKNHLGQEQVESILRIVHDFSLDFYTKHVYPKLGIIEEMHTQ